MTIIAGVFIGLGVAAAWLGTVLRGYRMGYERGYKHGTEFVMEAVDDILIPDMLESVRDLVSAIRPDARVEIIEPGDDLPEPEPGKVSSYVFPRPRIVRPYDQERDDA